jgi:hypothetical protein
VQRRRGQECFPSEPMVRPENRWCLHTCPGPKAHNQLMHHPPAVGRSPDPRFRRLQYGTLGPAGHSTKESLGYKSISAQRAAIEEPGTNHHAMSVAVQQHRLLFLERDSLEVI